MEQQPQFVSEPIIPVAGTMGLSAMASGEPGFPQRFCWRDVEYTVCEIVACWKESGACRNGSSDRYVRKHWYRIRTTDGSEMKLYFERQPRSHKQRKERWWLFSVIPAED